MATFESVFADLLQNELEERLKIETLDEDENVVETEETNVIISNDVQWHPLNDDANSVGIVLRGGNETKSEVLDYDLNTLMLTATIFVKSNNIQRIISACNEIAAADNAVLKTLTVNGIEYNYKGIYSTPYVVGSPYELRTKSGTIKAINAIWAINISYSTKGIIEQPNAKLIINDTEYSVNYIARYEGASTLNSEPYQAEERKTLYYSPRSHTYTYHFVLQCVKNGLNTLQDKLERVIMGIDTVSSVSLKYYIGTSAATIPMQTWTISKVWEGGSAAIDIILSR